MGDDINVDVRKGHPMKLSPASEAIVKATAAAVAENAETITKTFYPDMSAAPPGLMRVSNKANQATGEQPKALAASVVAYAVNLIDPNAPDFTPVMQRIAHKHVSLGIKAQEYTIVGHHLMKAVGTVLGDAVTPEVAAAWDEVYWLMAETLITMERGRGGGSTPTSSRGCTPPCGGRRRGTRPASTWRSRSTCRVANGSHGSTPSRPARGVTRCA